eukprot:gb/GECG01016790.1/.p1 GENE.gb/GECG01016790.1/~~gb/GECG01016790.1/.p1  ORF type:complete len:156 (+),score=11.83 gb/GECG01016790.1/:1-468(+)
MSQILDNLYVGGLEAAQDWEFITHKNIKYILNTTKQPSNGFMLTGIPNYYESNPQITYKRCPLDDDLNTEIKMHIPDCVEFINEGLRHGGVLIHCAAGVSRSVSVTIGYLMMQYNMSFHQALEFVQDRRPGAFPNPNFQNQLQNFEQELAQIRKQ